MEQSPDLENLLLRLCEAVSQGDLAFLDQLFSKQGGILMIGTDPNEWWTDLAIIMQSMGAQTQAGIRVVLSDPQAYREGSVGWVAGRVKFVLPDGTEVPFRVTAVFHQEGGAWKLVQAHNSIGIPNEEALGVDI